LPEKTFPAKTGSDSSGPPPQLATSAVNISATGFVIADVTLIFAAGLPPVRRFFVTHGVAVTRLVGVIFILFGARSIADAAGGAMRRAA
jgi:hypothetical protein